jgi:phosphomannomutase
MNSLASFPPSSLRAELDHEPAPLRFGTSGRRGEVIHLTQIEVYLNALAEIEYLQSLPATEGSIRRGDEFFLAYDLRPSSTRFVPEQQGRGELAQAIVQAIHDAGMVPVNLGAIPTPALTFHALQRGKGSMMVTGSHIPFDRNGYKTNSAKGELLKKDEAPINARVEEVRRRLYAQPLAESPFDQHGMLKSGHSDLPPEDHTGREAYVQRYTGFFAGQSLKGQRLLVYQHSAVGRDLFVEVLEKLGAQVIPAGRSDTFVPIDTENIDAAQLAQIQALADEAWRRHGPFDAVVSLDGDSDRPLILGVEAVVGSGSLQRDPMISPPAVSPCRVRFCGGDLVGMIVAEFLNADAVVVPVSCNDAIDRGPLRDRVEPKTRIGSPFVIASMEQARAKGRRRICGWEANGGFLLGSDLERDGRVLKALPTRDALLPILATLFSAKEQGLSLSALFDRLPKRFSRAALLKHFPRAVSLRMIQQLSPGDPAIRDVVFEGRELRALSDDGRALPASDDQLTALWLKRERLSSAFTTALGFGEIARLNYTDGVRIYFNNGDVAHVRPSGNADELRIYAVADTQARADEIARLGIAESDGILRKLAQRVAG